MSMMMITVQKVRLCPEKKKAIIWMGEMVRWGSGLISVKERGRRQTTDSVDRPRRSKTAITTHTGGDRCH